MSTKSIYTNSHSFLKKIRLIQSNMAVQRWRLPYLGWKEITKGNVSKTGFPNDRDFYKSYHLPSQGLGLKGWQMSVAMIFP